jgi:hypothetical protein
VRRPPGLSAICRPCARRGPGAQIDGVSERSVPKDELEAAIEARKELGAEMEPALIDGFVERIERRLAERGAVSERALKQRRDHQKEMVLGERVRLTPLRTRGLARVRQHADLVMIARLGRALVRARAVPLAA